MIIISYPKASYALYVSRSNKVRLKQLEDNASEALLDLDSLSGLTEISLDMERSNGVKSITKTGVSMGPLLSKVVVPSQLVTMVPRYVVVNESEESICVRQCYLQVLLYLYYRGSFLFISFHLS